MMHLRPGPELAEANRPAKSGKVGAAVRPETPISALQIVLPQRDAPGHLHRGGVRIARAFREGLSLEDGHPVSEENCRAIVVGTVGHDVTGRYRCREEYATRGGTTISATPPDAADIDTGERR